MPFIRLLLTSTTLLLCSMVPSALPSTTPTSHACANEVISIKVSEAVDHQDICRSTDDALTFFRQLDLEPSGPLVVEIVSSLPDAVSKTAVGCYLEDERRILVLTLPAFQERKKWFGIPIDRIMYGSVVTHEVAHAVASCSFQIPDPAIQAKEYVAYVAMFSMMNPNLRKRILLANPGAGFDSELEMNEVIYMFAPMRFGVEAYRHYLKKEHGDTFLLRVLSGNALISREFEF